MPANTPDFGANIHLAEKAGKNSAPEQHPEVKPRLLVLTASSFAVGASLIVFGTEKVIIAVLLVAVLSLRIFNVKSLYLILITLSLLAGALNASLRAPQASQRDISRLCGKDLFICGKILELAETEKLTRLTIECMSAQELCHNTVRQHSVPVTGRLQATLYLNSNPIEQKHSGPKEIANPPLAWQNAANSNVQSAAKKCSFLAPGDKISFCAKPLSLLKLAGRKQQSIAILLARKGIFCTAKLRVATLNLICHNDNANAAGNPLEANASSCRNSLVAFHCRTLGDVNGSLLASMVLGDKAVVLDKEIKDEFRASGLSHVLAASGFNLSIVAATIYFALRLFSANLWITNAICFSGMLAFVFVAGPSPSVVRAFLMGSLLLLSRCLGRSLHMPAALCFTMFAVILIDPWATADIGFQLSYFSTAGMILAASQLGLLISRKVPKIPQWIQAVLAATLVAQACVLPLQLFYFRQFTPYCILANVAVTPLVSPITIIGFAASLLYALESTLHLNFSISTWLDKLAYLPVELLRQLVKAISSFPSAQISTGQTHIATVLLYYGILLLFPFLISIGRWKIWSLLYALSFLLMIVSIFSN